MGLWFKGKIEQEQSDLVKEMGLMSARMVRLEAEIEVNSQAVKVLRGFVNKKLKLEVDEPDDEPDVPIKEVHEDGFDELRALRVEHGS